MPLEFAVEVDAGDAGAGAAGFGDAGGGEGGGGAGGDLPRWGLSTVKLADGGGAARSGGRGDGANQRTAGR